MTTSLWEQVRRATTAYGDLPCLVVSDTAETITFDTMAELFSSLAELLGSNGLTSQDRIAVLMRNSAAFIALEGACAASGITVVPINFYSSVDEVVHHIQHSGSRALVIDLDDDDLDRAEAVREQLGNLLFLAFGSDPDRGTPGWARHLEPKSGGEIAPSGSALLPDDAIHRIMYTSATTGVAKGVLCPYGNWVANTVATGSNQLRDVAPGDRFLAATPFTHMSIGYFWTFYSLGATTVSMRKFSPRAFVDVIVAERITHTLLVPTMIIDIVRHLQQNPDDAERLRGSRLRAVWYAGSPMPAAVATEASALMGPILNQQYGLTEMFSVSLTMCATMLRASDHDGHPGSCGRALTGTSVRVVDEQGTEILEPGTPGELHVKTTGIVAGYLDNPVATEETFGGGWLRTGDIATIDDHGYVTIVDRQKDMIISGGFNIYSAEVEGVLQAHPEVAACAVVGRPDPTWVEVPVAFVVPTAGAVASEAEIIAFARERLAHYKAPKAVILVPELPKNAIGKVAKRDLREQAATGAAS